MRCLNNSNVPGFTAKAVDIASPEYTERVAGPVMNAVDTMPRAYRELVNEFGYVDVYRAWRRGLTPQAIKDRAFNGTFQLS
jgi:hypothetical protein